MKRPWPNLSYLSWRASRHAWLQQLHIQYEQELLEEKRRARDGVRIQTMEQFSAGLAKGMILARILGEVYEWSSWISHPDTREFNVTIYVADSMSDDPSFSTLVDNRGVPVGLYEPETMKLDHFVGWEEFLENYQKWSKTGIPEGLILAPMDVDQLGFVQDSRAHAELLPQPNDGMYLWKKPVVEGEEAEEEVEEEIDETGDPDGVLPKADETATMTKQFPAT
jgi:hypothetical protein